MLASFGAFGAFWGAWGAVLPAVQHDARVGDAQLGLALLLIGLGALVSMRVAGTVIDRFGHATTAVIVLCFGAAGMLPALASSPAQLSVALFALGVTSGAMDVAINAEAVSAEERSGERLLNLAHAAFSGAVLSASVLTGVLRAVDASPEIVLGTVAVALLVVAARLSRSEPACAAPLGSRPRGSRIGAPSGLLVIGALCALAYWVENAWQSWSAVHLERNLAASPGVSALGPAAFATAAMLGRLTGQRLAPYRSDRALVAVGAGLAAAGTALAATAPSVPLGLLGIVLAGGGTSVCAPTLISLAGASVPPEQHGAAVGTVTTIAYLGFVLGPAAVGGLAGLVTLRASLAAVACLALILAVATVLAPLPRRRNGATPLMIDSP